MRPKLTIVTVHKGPLIDLVRTVDSIYPRLDEQTEHVVVARIPDIEISALHKLCARSKLIMNEDTSLYDAMNKGIVHSGGEFINFINSGDELCTPIPVGELTEKSCYMFVPTLAIDGGLLVASGCRDNHQNFFAPNDCEILFDEKYQIFADAHWMNRMIAKYDVSRFLRQYAIFYYGGLSTRPTLIQACRNMRFDVFLLPRLRLLIKAVFISIGAERINKYLLRRGYR